MRVLVEITPDEITSFTTKQGVKRWQAKQSAALYDADGQMVRSERHQVGIRDEDVEAVRNHIGKPITLQVRVMAFASEGSRFPRVVYVDGVLLSNGAT